MMALVPYVLYFLLVSLVISLVTSVMRLGEPRKIAGETARFFVAIVLGIGLFAVIVYFVEWIFIRPLI